RCARPAGDRAGRRAASHSRTETPPGRGTQLRGEQVKLSISFFGSGQEGVGAPERYETVLALGRLADTLGLHAVWVPERHFQDFGDLFPQPAVLAAALAATTERVGIRAGSVVLPLHHPVRVLEDWSMVDAISNGR